MKRRKKYTWFFFAEFTRDGLVEERISSFFYTRYKNPIIANRELKRILGEELSTNALQVLSFNRV